jgi:hypothetical protein
MKKQQTFFSGDFQAFAHFPIRVSISTTFFMCAAFKCANGLVLNLYFANTTMPNFASPLNINLPSTFTIVHFSPCTKKISKKLLAQKLPLEY